MIRHDISAATFIRNNLVGAFCLLESMASFLPLVDDMTIIDLGSTDGTRETLREIADANSRVRIIESHFSRQDAGAFADVANECVGSWKHNVGLFWQADEIWHENLLLMLDKALSEGAKDHIFWRYQLRQNFQGMKWPPHPIHRLGTRGNFNFVGDGMNTDRYFEPPVLSNWDMGWFIRWGDDYKGRYPELPTEEMVMDVSAIGGFIDSIRKKRELHAPMWHERPNVEGEGIDSWLAHEVDNPLWNATESPFLIPTIMKWHVGRRAYIERSDLIEAIKDDDTGGFLGL